MKLSQLEFDDIRSTDMPLAHPNSRAWFCSCTVRKSVSERTVDVCRVRHGQEIDPDAILRGDCTGFTPLVRCAEAVAPQAAIRDSAIR